MRIIFVNFHIVPDEKQGNPSQGTTKQVHCRGPNATGMAQEGWRVLFNRDV